MLPTAGEDVQIPSSWWMVYDVEMEGLGTVCFIFLVVKIFISARDIIFLLMRLLFAKAV